jgi:hypothetical protein
MVQTPYPEFPIDWVSSPNAIPQGFTSHYQNPPLQNWGLFQTGQLFISDICHFHHIYMLLFMFMDLHKLSLKTPVGNRKRIGV